MIVLFAATFYIREFGLLPKKNGDLTLFNVLGHTRSWGEGIKDLLTVCYDKGKPNGYLGPIDPTKDSTYVFLRKFFGEVVSVFPDKFVHLGGDEVDFECWSSNSDVGKFMKQNNFTKYTELEEYYIQKLVNMMEELKSKSVVWEEVFNNGVKIHDETIVHVWKDSSTINKTTNAGVPSLYSACWYLDHLKSNGDWQDFYKCEPRELVDEIEQMKYIIGGEACMWSEVVDVNNIISRVWPRASAVAERLWSSIETKDIKAAEPRLEEHVCRMNKRGIGAQPANRAGFCV